MSVGATIITRDGRSIPFGGDEDPERKIISASASTQIPGGFGPGSLVVPRVVGIDAVDAPLLAEAKIYGPGGRVGYEGRVATKPRIGVNEIELELEGWSAHLDDDVFREFYVSRDLGRFEDPSLERQLILNPSPGTVGENPFTDSAEVTPSTEGPALKLSISDQWDPATGEIPLCETWLDAGPGLKVARLMADYTTFVGNSASFELNTFSSDDDTTPLDLVDQYTVDGVGTIDYQPTARRRVGMFWIHPSAGGAENAEWAIYLTDVGIYGDHGLDLHATEDGGAMGVRGDDVLRDALSRACPLLDIDDIEPSAFVIPELVFQDWDSRARGVVEQVTLLGGGGGGADVLMDWGVYEKRRFFWRTPGSYGLTHTVRLDEGVNVTGEGEDTGELATAFVATFTDSAGREKAYGYPGSGADFESEFLVSTDPLNPIVDSEVPRKVITKNVGKTNPEGALLLAQLAFEEAVRTTRTGSYSVPPHESRDDPMFIRAGDRIIVADDVAYEQAIVQTEWDLDSGNTEVHVGAAPKKLDVALAQLAMATAAGNTVAVAQ